jgi:pimeloyl-ACP methyl ester carboxylesterase
MTANWRFSMADGHGWNAGNLQVGTCNVHYWTTGPKEAPWFVVSHGGGLSYGGFRPLAEKLAGRFQVLLWDMPGHGASQPMPQSYSVSHNVEALKALFDALAIRSATLMGHSFGGVVTQAFAHRYPEREEGFIVFGALMPQLMGPAAPSWLAPVVLWYLYGRHPWPRIKADWACMCCHDKRHWPGIEADLDRLGRANFLAMFRAALTFSDTDPQWRVRGPLDYVIGEHDPAHKILQATFKRLRTAYPAAQVITIPGAGHCAHQDLPAAFSEAIETILQRHLPNGRVVRS